MSNLSLYNSTSSSLVPSGGGSRLPATVRRDLTSLQNDTIVRSARIQATEYLGAEAMHAVVGLSELEGQLASMSPLATSRLQVIGNLASLQIARILHG